jgi:outer membrane protein assembly factor BamA
VDIAKASVSDYNNTNVINIANRLTKLSEDWENIIGYEGGWDSGLKFSVVYDSRDFAPNPKNGSIHDLTVDLYGSFIGSDFEHQRYTFSTKNFFTPVGTDFFTLALRGIYSIQTGNTPFFDKNIISFADNYSTGLGGYRTLRGYAQDRFIADVKVLTNVEARFNFYETDQFGQSFEFMAVPFIDAGKVFDKVTQTDLIDYKVTYGSGLRIAWNQATIIMMDYGKNSEESGLYINFGHIF